MHFEYPDLDENAGQVGPLMKFNSCFPFALSNLGSAAVPLSAAAAAGLNSMHSNSTIYVNLYSRL